MPTDDEEAFRAEQHALGLLSSSDDEGDGGGGGAAIAEADAGATSPTSRQLLRLVAEQVGPRTTPPPYLHCDR